MMRASVPDILRENIERLEGELSDHRRTFGAKDLYTSVEFDYDEVRHIIDDLRDVLGQIEKEGDHGTTTP